MATGATEFIDATIADGVFSPDVWSKEVIVSTEAELIFAKLVNRQFEKDARIGKSVKIASIGDLAARAKSENTAITYETVAETTVSITINNWIYAAIGIEQIVELQSQIDLRSKYQAKMGYALAKYLDDVLADLVAGLSQTVGTLGTNLTDDDILNAITTLRRNNVPKNDWALVLSEGEAANLLRYDKFTSSDYVDGRPVQNGRVGKIFGVPVYSTTNLNSPGANQADNVLFQKEAFALVMQQDPKMHLFYDIDYFTWKIAGEMVFGKAEIRDGFGVWAKGKT